MNIEVDDGGLLIGNGAAANDASGAEGTQPKKRRAQRKPKELTSEERRDLYETRQTNFWTIVTVLLHQKLVAQGCGVEKMTPNQMEEHDLDKLLERLAAHEAAAVDGRRC